MNISIALLRGINVGGNNIIKMETLRKVLTDAGLEDVATYIQSGNIVFRHKKSMKDADCAALIAAVIKEHFGLSIPVIVRSLTAWEQILRSNPFAADGRTDAENWHYMMLSEEPAADLVPAIDKALYEPDRFEQVGNNVFLHIQKFGNTKLSNTLFDKKWKVISTVRNHKTMLAITALADKLK
ncbi:hypothetical protein D3C72_1355000 [compost metagenome]